MKEVTIIAPIYNVEKYLRDCFESLLKQTSDRFEVLAVNDGSKDGCKSIIDEYTEKYPKSNGFLRLVFAVWYEIVTFAKLDNGDVLVLTASDIGR